MGVMMMDIDELPKELLEKIAAARIMNKNLREEIIDFIEKDERFNDWDNWEKGQCFDLLIGVFEGRSLGVIESNLQKGKGDIIKIFKKQGVNVS
jgi:hypothetical protein